MATSLTPVADAVVLGVNLGHDRSACLAVDGRLEVAIAEERLSRVKHDIPVNERRERYCTFPSLSADYCLKTAGVAPGDVDLVVASTTYVLDSDAGQRRALTPDDVRWQCPDFRRADVRVVPHHLSHAASAALYSGFDRSVVLVIDGGGSPVGDEAAPLKLERTSVFLHGDDGLTLVKRSCGGPPAYGNSLGDLYQAVTMFLGFGAGEEGKTMGLAGHGGTTHRPANDGPAIEEFCDAVTVHADATHEVSDLFQFTAEGGFHPGFVSCFGPPRGVPRPEEQTDRDLASSAQWAIERAILELADAAHRLTGENLLCMAGGVALNCVANGRVLREGPYRDLFIQPAASDDGTALGNVLLATGSGSGDTAPSAFLGRGYTSSEIMEALTEKNHRVRWERSQNPAAAVASDVGAGAITAVFRGGAEFGPRALGHRSIFCDPRSESMKDHLNLQVKHREPFRPFAPIVKEERSSDYFDLDVPSPYMLLSADVRDPDRIPAVTHVDGTARVQTVREGQEPFVWAVLDHLERDNGTPVVLNTSFNDREPIVETPEDALRCFLSTGIDVLYLEDVRVTKPDVR